MYLIKTNRSADEDGKGTDPDFVAEDWLSYF
jgi:hypothetical protein